MGDIIGVDGGGYYDDDGYVSNDKAAEKDYTVSGSDYSTFNIDTDNSDDDYLYVDVFGKGTVVIKNEETGLVVDIYPLNVVDEPVGSIWVHNNDLMEEQS